MQFNNLKANLNENDYHFNYMFLLDFILISYAGFTWI